MNSIRTTSQAAKLIGVSERVVLNIAGSHGKQFVAHALASKDGIYLRVIEDHEDISSCDYFETLISWDDWSGDLTREAMVLLSEQGIRTNL